MPPDARAILFDLDDTLYPLEQFVKSGFRAAAAHVEKRWGYAAERALAVLTAAFAVARGHELDLLAERLLLPAGAVATLIEVMREHEPRLRLSPSTLGVLVAMRATWRVGIVTNGRADIQARKVAALGLAPHVDAVVLASEHGTGAGKPDAAPFLAACAALGVAPSRTVFVGDDLTCDMAGARAVGMATIWIPSATAGPTGPPAAGATGADCTLPSLAGVPAAATQLLASRWSSHVA